jgi:hypothetical protein
LQTQFAKVELPTGEYVFEGHPVHAEVDEEYFPASQFAQFPAPVEALYFPASHGVHATPFCCAYVPALQTQFAKVELPTGEYVFEGHPVQAEVDEEYFPASQFAQFPAPVEALYCPAPHGVHAAPSTPDVPALQTQLFTLPLPAPEYVFEGQGEQDAAPAPEYFPASHDEQSLLPAVEYFPALQPRQVFSLDSPSPSEALPAAQSLHALVELPLVAKYFPTGQDVHCVFASSVVYLPIGQ